MAELKYRVSSKAPEGLFIRKEPVVEDKTKIALLPMGQLVYKKSGSDVPKWWLVRTTLDGSDIEGYVNSTYLTPEAEFEPPKTQSKIGAVHLGSSGTVSRNSTGLWAFPLNEKGQKTRNPKASQAEKATELTAIVKWLDVENKARYAPKSPYTYCNIYAYDYCYLARVYLPRVWWFQDALEKLKKGKAITPIYGQTVGELNANSLFNWLRDFGSDFGWQRTFDISHMQDAANKGQVAIICAQNRIPNISGHICAVVPETASNKAKRDGKGVTHPLQSEAGANNKMYSTRSWWYSETFRDFGFWINLK